ncbi:MAG: YHYH protein [Anaerolineae bacterium]
MKKQAINIWFSAAILLSALVLISCGGPGEGGRGGGGDVGEASDGLSNSGLETADYPTPVELANCPADTFLAVTADPANSDLTAPELSVTCEGEEMVIVSNNMPNFEYVAITPGTPGPQEIAYRIPLNPEFADTTTGVPMLGTSAIAVNGQVIYGPTEGTTEDPFLNQLLDYCGGHNGPGARYHFHTRPLCLFDDFDGNVGLVVAWSLDGFPVLAPFLCEDASCSSVKEIESSWVDANPDELNSWVRHEYVEEQSELDICNGMLFEDGSYAYFATETFPYLMGCYRGTPVNAGLGGVN